MKSKCQWVSMGVNGDCQWGRFPLTQPLKGDKKNRYRCHQKRGEKINEKTYEKQNLRNNTNCTCCNNNCASNLSSEFQYQC